MKDDKKKDSIKIRDYFPPEKKTISVKVAKDLYAEVLKKLTIERHSVSDLIEACFKMYLDTPPRNGDENDDK